MICNCVSHLGPFRQGTIHIFPLHASQICLFRTMFYFLYHRRRCRLPVVVVSSRLPYHLFRNTKIIPKSNADWITQKPPSSPWHIDMSPISNIPRSSIHASVSHSRFIWWHLYGFNHTFPGSRNARQGMGYTSASLSRAECERPASSALEGGRGAR